MQKTFRLFVSSTFSDFTEERKLLQTIVFPEIKRYCSSKKLNFQPIDLRWGVTEDASNDQKTLELCIEEVQNCKLQPYPNFLIMLGDRCGTIILPYTINKEEFETILNNVKKYKRIEKLLKTWYKLDENQIPASYIIEQRKDTQNSHDGIDYTIRNNWKPINTRLIKIFKIVVSKIDLEESKKNKYFKSATEVEVIEGIFKYLDKTPFQNRLLEKDSELINKDHEHVYSYIRNIRTLDNETLKDRFIDEEDISDVKRFKETLKSSIKKENILEVNVNLTNVKQDEKNNSLNYQYDEIKDIEDSMFVNRIITYLKKSIDEYSNIIKDLTPKELELEEQKRFKNDKLKDFLEGSRTKALDEIKNYIDGKNNQALVVYGKSGLGKSSLMAKAIEHSEIRFENTNTKVIYKFVGSTSNLTNTPFILISILNELGINEEIRKVTNPETGQKEPEKLGEFYYRIHDHLTSISQNTIIFLDAIDQINNEDEFIWLPKNLPSNLKIIISALDDVNYLKDSTYFENLKEITTNLYPLEEFEENDAEKFIINILERYNRTITQTQMDYLLNIYKDVKTPLYLSVAAQELRHWKSSDINQTLAISQSEIIKEFIENLTKLYHHDKEFVKRVFSYLYLSDGLSETELLEILSIDKEFIEYIAPNTYHKKESNELPIVIWARLHSQIKEFLKLENKENQETMRFFYREFNELIRTKEIFKQDEEKFIELLIIIISKIKNFDRWIEIIFNAITNYHIKYEFDYDISKNTKLYEYCLRISYNLRSSIFEEVFEYLNKKRKNIDNEIVFCHLKINYFISEFVYFNKNDFDEYLWGLNNYAILLEFNNEIDDAIKIHKEIINTSKRLYKYKGWESTYIRSLSNYAYLLCSNGKVEEGIKFYKKVIKFLRYKDKNWLEEYSLILDNFSLSLKTIGRMDEAKKIERQSLKLKSDLLEIRKKEKDSIEDSLKNPFGIDMYMNKLNALSQSLKDLGQIEEVIKINKKVVNFIKISINQSEGFYSRSLFIREYVRSLNYLAEILQLNGEIEESVELNIKALVSIKELYIKNNKWLKDYIVCLSNTGKSLRMNAQIDEYMEIKKEFKCMLNSVKEEIGRSLLSDEEIRENLFEILENFYVKNTKETYQLENYRESIYYYSCLTLNSVGQVKKVNEFKKDFFKLLIEFEKRNFDFIESLINEKYENTFIISELKSIANLAIFFRLIGKFDKSKELFEKYMFYKNELHHAKWVSDYTKSLTNLAVFFDEIDKTEEAIKLNNIALKLRKKCYEEHPQKFTGEYVISLINLGCIYYNSNEYKKSIFVLKKSLKLIKNLYVADNTWKEAYLINLRYLGYSSYILKEYSTTFYSLKKFLELITSSYIDNPIEYYEEYLTALKDLGSFYIILKEFKESSKLFEEYFKIVDFNNIDDIRDFIYPLIKWYQSERYLKNYLKLEELKDLALNFTNIYKEKLDSKFEEEINEIFEVYKDLSDNSDDALNKEKFEIFQLIFFK